MAGVARDGPSVPGECGDCPGDCLSLSEMVEGRNSRHKRLSPFVADRKPPITPRVIAARCHCLSLSGMVESIEHRSPVADPPSGKDRPPASRAAVGRGESGPSDRHADHARDAMPVTARPHGRRRCLVHPLPGWPAGFPFGW